jgi:DNA-directed RNA polymerase specialized sigma24 family protein
MLKTLKMDADDLYQELSICLLKAIETFDPTRGAKEANYYFKMLRYGVLNLWNAQMRQIHLANVVATPLTTINKNGEVVAIDMPVVIDFDANVQIGEFMHTLSLGEQNALARTVSGEGAEDKRHQRFMFNVKRKALRYHLGAGGAA